MKHKLLHLAVLLVLMAGQAVAQNNWDKYEPRTLKEVTTVLAAKHLKDPDVQVSQGRENEIILSYQSFPSRVKVIYTGSSRKMSERRKEVIAEWLKVMGKPKDYLDMFETEYLFTEDSVQYWLPVQKQVAAYFKDELRPNEQVNLYVVWMGARKEQGQVEHVFIVNEFKKQ